MNIVKNTGSFTRSTSSQEIKKEAGSYEPIEFGDIFFSTFLGFNMKESPKHLSSITDQSSSKAKTSEEDENFSRVELSSTLETITTNLSNEKFEDETKISDPDSIFDYKDSDYGYHDKYPESDDSDELYPAISKKEDLSFRNECKQEIYSFPQTGIYVSIQDGLEITNVILKDEIIALEFEFYKEIMTENLDEILNILCINSNHVAKVQPRMSFQNKMKYIITFIETNLASFYFKELNFRNKGTVKPFFEKNQLKDIFEEICLEIRISTIETQEIKKLKLQYKNSEDLTMAKDALKLYGDSFGVYLYEEAIDNYFNVLTIQYLDSNLLENYFEVLVKTGLFRLGIFKPNIRILSKEKLVRETKEILQYLDIQYCDSAILIQIDDYFVNQKNSLTNFDYQTVRVTLDSNIKTQTLQTKKSLIKNYAKQFDLFITKKTYFIIEDCIYKIILEKLTDMIKFLGDSNIKYSMERIKSMNSRKICFEGEENENYMNTIQQITQLIQGTEIIIQENLISKCFNFTSRTFFSILEQEYGTENLHIRLKLNPARICIYFMLEDEEIVSVINDFMTDLTCKETLNVDLSIHSLKTLNNLLEAFNPHSYVLKNSGSKGRALITAKNEILSQISDNLDSILDLNGKKSCYANCKICYQPLGEDCVKLQACGHNYCKSCIDMLFSAYVDSSSLILECPEDSCHAKISLSDIHLHCSPYAFKLAIQKNLHRYLIENSKYYRHCPNPQCLEMFKHQGEENFECKYCLKSYCLKDVNVPHTIQPVKSRRKCMTNIDSGIDDESLKRMKCCNPVIEKTTVYNPITAIAKTILAALSKIF